MNHERRPAAESGIPMMPREELRSAFISQLADEAIAQIMVATATVDENEPLSVLPGKLASAPVLIAVDHSGMPVGVVNANGLLQYLARHGRDDFRDKTVGEVMSTAFSELSADMSVGTAAEHLALAGDQYAAVVDDQHRLVGMLTPRMVLDLATAPLRQAAGVEAAAAE